LDNVIKLSRHPGMDCRDLDYRDVLKLAILGNWIPAFPAGMTGFLNGNGRLEAESGIRPVCPEDEKTGFRGESLRFSARLKREVGCRPTERDSFELIKLCYLTQ
jgi:hypothetical protein